MRQSYSQTAPLHNEKVSNQAQSSAWRDSLAAQVARLTRQTIRKAKLTRAERDVVIVIANQWFYETRKPTGIAPGRERIAKRAGCSVRTVASTLARLREAGALEVVGCANGGKGNTRYRLHLKPLYVFCGAVFPEEYEAEMVAIEAVETTPKAATEKSGIAHDTRAKIAHGEPRSIYIYKYARLAEKKFPDQREGWSGSDLPDQDRQSEGSARPDQSSDDGEGQRPNSHLLVSENPAVSTSANAGEGERHA